MGKNLEGSAKGMIASVSSATSAITCSTCLACCCRLEVMLISETGVPERFIDTDEWGAQTMLRLEDGWCAALDRSTHLCSIYENRPWICREFSEGEPDCIDQRVIFLRP